MKNLRNRKSISILAQGTIEYLVIIAVVILMPRILRGLTRPADELAS